jgi:hypothetical protein
VKLEIVWFLDIGQSLAHQFGSPNKDVLNECQPTPWASPQNTELEKMQLPLMPRIGNVIYSYFSPVKTTR